MAREKDENKRNLILTAAKRLFASRGFEETSVALIASETGLPVGTLYTYFKNKHDIVQTIIEEGWAFFYNQLSGLAQTDQKPAQTLSVIIYQFLPALFEDLDLISIILARADKDTKLAEKLAQLGLFFSELINDLAEEQGLHLTFTPQTAMTAVGIFLLGSIDVLRVARRAELPVTAQDVTNFIMLSVQNSFGISLVPLVERAG